MNYRARDTRKRKRRLPALDRYVIFSLGALAIFTVTAIVYQFVSGQEISSTLCTCFFSAFGGELLMLCLIKRLKLKEKDKEDEI